MQVLYFDPDAVRAVRFCEQFPDAVCVRTPEQAIEKLTAGHFGTLCIYQYHNCEECTIDTFEYRQDSDDVVNWIMTYMPTIRRIWIHGEDFDTIAKYRASLQAMGYAVFYMPLDNMLTFTTL